MQVARLLEPRSGRSFAAKLRQIVRAIEIERALSKDEVLALYLDLAPYGGNIEGIRAASLAYFGKEPRRLSLGEAALLVALPQSPELRRPDRSADAARGGARPRARPLSPRPALCRPTRSRSPRPSRCRRRAAPMPMLAPHAADRRDRRTPRRAARCGSTIDADLQKNLEELAREHVRTLWQTLGPDVSLAHAGRRQRHRRSAGPRRLAGLFRSAPRRPGRHDASAALARLDVQALHLRARLRGRLHPSRDADRRPAGPLRRLRAAEFRFHLSGHGDGAPGAAECRSTSRRSPCSIRSVRAAWPRGSPRRAPRWCCRDGEAPGLAIGLGGVGIKLSDLVMLYAGIARLGTVLPLVERASPAPQSAHNGAGTKLMEPVAAWYVEQRTDRHAAAGERRRPAASPSRPAPATAIATPGRSASTASTPSASGSAGRTARRCRG